MTPPNTLAHFKSLYCYCYPSKNFHSTISFIFHSCSFVFIRFPFVFTRVHSCSIRVHSFTRVHSCSIRVPLVFTRVHSCSFVFHSCSFVFTRVHSCSFVFIRVHSCSFVFRSVWCFRYDLQQLLIAVRSQRLVTSSVLSPTVESAESKKPLIEVNCYLIS